MLYKTTDTMAIKNPEIFIRSPIPLLLPTPINLPYNLQVSRHEPAWDKNVIKATSDALPVRLMTYIPIPNAHNPLPIAEINSPVHNKRNLRKDLLLFGFDLYLP